MKPEVLQARGFVEAIEPSGKAELHAHCSCVEAQEKSVQMGAMGCG